MAVVDIDHGRAEAVAADLRRAGGEAEAFVTDVTHRGFG